MLIHLQMSMASFMQQQQSWVVMKESQWPAKPKTFTTCLFTEKSCGSLRLNSECLEGRTIWFSTLYNNPYCTLDACYVSVTVTMLILNPKQLYEVTCSYFGSIELREVNNFLEDTQPISPRPMSHTKICLFDPKFMLLTIAHPILPLHPST